MAGLDPFRQFGAQLTVIEALVHMGQDGAARPQPLHPGQHLGEVRMRRVRLAAQTIDNPQLDALKRRESIGAHFRCDYPRRAADPERSRFTLNEAEKIASEFAELPVRDGKRKLQ